MLLHRALKKSHAGIYRPPHQRGMSLGFRFSGQSIPNRCPEQVAPLAVSLG